jgi:hypothetical protein
MAQYKQLIQIQRCLVGECEHEVTVRNINGRYHVRVLLNGEVNQEAVCDSKAHIGDTARSLLRWEDKCGNISDFASYARARQKSQDVCLAD